MDMFRFSNDIKKTPRPFIAVALIAALIATDARAAVLSNFEGDVSVNRGDGFQPVSLGAVLNPGYRLRTGEGTANIRYDNGCTATIPARQVVVVSSRPPVCEATGGLKDGGMGAPQQAYGVTPVDPAEPFIVGGIAASAAGLAILIAHSNGSETRSVSP